MTEPSPPQRHQFGCLDVLALVAAAGEFVEVLVPAVRAGRPALVAITTVVGLLLVPVAFVAAWYALASSIVATLWLFSVDRDFPSDNPIFPGRWWDFRPVLVIALVGGAWLACGVPLLDRLRWGDWHDWPAVIVLAIVVPMLTIGMAARRWLPA